MAIVRCKRCYKACKGDVLKVKDNFYHSDCFKCSACDKSLAQEGYYLKDDECYCRKDYKKLLAKICDTCGAYILGDMVSVLEKFFHHSCFYCHTCKKNFIPGMRVTCWNDAFYCSTCFTRIKSVKNTSKYFPSKKIQFAGDSDEQAKSVLTEDNNIKIPQEPEAFTEKPIASNLSNQAQDDLCSSFCKELAQRLAVQYLQCENHVADGTNLKIVREQEPRNPENEQAISEKSVNRSQSDNVSCTVSDSDKGDVNEQSEIQTTTGHETKENIPESNSLIQTESFLPSQDTPPMQPSVRRSYLHYENTGKVAAVVKFLEGLPSQMRFPVEKKGDESFDTKKRTKAHRSLDRNSTDSHSSETKSSSPSGLSCRAQSQDVRGKCPTASMAEHNFPVHVAITPTSPYVSLEQTRSRPRDKYTSHSQVVVTIRPAVSPESSSVSPPISPQRKTPRSVDNPEHRKAWPPVRPGIAPVVRKRATFRPTPFVEATNACSGHSPTLLKPNDDDERGRQSNDRAKQRNPPETMKEWIDMCEQDQSMIMDRICQRNAKYTEDMTTVHVEPRPSAPESQKSCLHCSDRIPLKHVSEVQPFAQYGRGIKTMATLIRGTKLSLYGRKRRTFIRNLMFSVAKMRQQAQDKRAIGSARREQGGTALKKSGQTISRVILHLFTATLVLFTVIGLLVWIAEMQQKSDQKQLQNIKNEYTWTSGWRSQGGGQ